MSRATLGEERACDTQVRHDRGGREDRRHPRRELVTDDDGSGDAGSRRAVSDVVSDAQDSPVPPPATVLLHSLRPWLCPTIGGASVRSPGPCSGW